MSDPAAVLLMAYGTPDSLDSVGAYFTHIRGGRAPSAESIAHLRERYELVGGTTPLLEITEAVRTGLAEAFAADGDPRRVFFGMKHWHPYIAETMREMKDAGARRMTALVLAPHFSRLSIGGYRKAIDEAQAALGDPFAIRFIERWGDAPAFIDLMTTLVQTGLAQWSPEMRGTVTVVFTAHSLPVRIREWDDPYERELAESGRRVAERLQLPHWCGGWQSAGGTAEPWIGPDILEVLERLHAEGVRDVLQVPIGFVSEHLEVLYDIDIEATNKASALGMSLRRTPLPNARTDFIGTLMAVIRAAERLPEDP